jgi:hypothetical protein
MKGRIYKIWSPSAGIFYYGSTTMTVTQRLASHRTEMMRYTKGLRNYCSSYEVLEFDDAQISTVAEIEYEDRYQLLQLEAFYIKSYDCVNRCVPWRSEKEKKQMRKEYNKAYWTGWYQENKERRRIYNDEYRRRMNKEKIECECGGKYTPPGKARHYNSKKHKKYFDIHPIRKLFGEN